MKAELTDLGGCKKNLDIEIPQEVVDAEILHIAGDFARKGACRVSVRARRRSASSRQDFATKFCLK
jgi:hypothetical protein